MSFDNLNTRQKSVLKFIGDYSFRNGFSPSVRDIAKAIGVSSTSTVHGYLEVLEKEGFIRRDSNKNRSIEILKDEEWRQKEITPIPLVGSVQAGLPVTAEECIEDVYPFPLQFIGSEDTFMLEVKGDSMREVGILEGDILFVRMQENANNGDIVVAMVDEDEATVKTFYREENHIRLQPENPDYEPIISRQVQILGKVIGVYRRYY